RSSGPAGSRSRPPPGAPARQAGTRATARSCRLPPYASRELTLGHASLQIFALVVQLLGFGERDHHLGDPVLEVQLERHERQSLAARAADQLADLVRVEQQLAGAGGRRIVVAAWEVSGDHHELEPHLTVAHMRVRLPEPRLAAPQRV